MGAGPQAGGVAEPRGEAVAAHGQLPGVPGDLAGVLLGAGRELGQGRAALLGLGLDRGLQLLVGGVFEGLTLRVPADRLATAVELEARGHATGAGERARRRELLGGLARDGLLVLGVRHRGRAGRGDDQGGGPHRGRGGGEQREERLASAGARAGDGRRGGRGLRPSSEGSTASRGFDRLALARGRGRRRRRHRGQVSAVGGADARDGVPRRAVVCHETVPFGRFARDAPP